MSALIPILLAGGSGSRLSPLSSPEFPKQFLTLPAQPHSMFRQSVLQAVELGVEAVVIVAPEGYLAQIKEQMRALDVPAGQVHFVFEPRAGGTAAAVMAAALYAATLNPHAVLWVLPCDHDRRAPLHLPDYRPQAMHDAQAGKLVTFGLPPLSPDSGYGYLRVDAAGDVLQFIEKPETSLAALLIATKQAWWNSGMFAFTAKSLGEEMAAQHPAMLASCRRAVERGRRAANTLWLADVDYGYDAPEPIDRVIMERSDRLVMHPLPASGWADIGTFERLLMWWETHAPTVDAWDFGSSRFWTKQAVSDAS